LELATYLSLLSSPKIDPSYWGSGPKLAASLPVLFLSSIGSQGSKLIVGSRGDTKEGENMGFLHGIGLSFSIGVYDTPFINGLWPGNKNGLLSIASLGPIV
jgi:hypothetical protein